jgi:glutamate carboxypeptidase
VIDPQALAETRRVALAAESELALLLDDLRTWVDLDTPGASPELLDAFARTFAERLERFGMTVELVPDAAGLYLHATLEGNGSAHVCLLGHHDTVFPEGTASARPFRIDGDRCHGPGVADMKGGLAVAAHAARLLATGPRPFARLELVSVPDEEARNGGPVTGERLLGMDAVLCLECGRPGGEIVSARKGARWFRMHAQGRAAHAGEAPHAGRNAAHALAREALRLAELHEARPGLTLQVTRLEAGEGLNTVPSRGSLTADLRAWTQADLDWASAAVQSVGEYEGIELRFEDLGGPPPLERTAAVATLAETAIALGGDLGRPFEETGAGGVSDGSWTASQGIPTLDGLGPAGGEDHTPFEYAEVGSFAPRCGVVAGLVAAVDAGVLAEPEED